jgi:hypothetical protein
MRFLKSRKVRVVKYQIMINWMRITMILESNNSFIKESPHLHLKLSKKRMSTPNANPDLSQVKKSTLKIFWTTIDPLITLKLSTNRIKILLMKCIPWKQVKYKIANHNLIILLFYAKIWKRRIKRFK